MSPPALQTGPLSLWDAWLWVGGQPGWQAHWAAPGRAGRPLRFRDDGLRSPAISPDPGRRPLAEAPGLPRASPGRRPLQAASGGRGSLKDAEPQAAPALELERVGGGEETSGGTPDRCQHHTPSPRLLGATGHRPRHESPMDLLQGAYRGDRTPPSTP